MTRSKNFDAQMIVPIDNLVKETLRSVAQKQDRSMTAQARYFIHQGLKLALEEEHYLDEVEADRL